MGKQNGIPDSWKEIHAKIGNLMDKEAEINWMLELLDEIFPKHRLRELLAVKEDEYCKLSKEITTIMTEYTDLLKEYGSNKEG